MFVLPSRYLTLIHDEPNLPPMPRSYTLLFMYKESFSCPCTFSQAILRSAPAGTIMLRRPLSTTPSSVLACFPLCVCSPTTYSCGLLDTSHLLRFLFHHASRSTPQRSPAPTPLITDCRRLELCPPAQARLGPRTRTCDDSIFSLTHRHSYRMQEP